jgi:hypothetical protein
MTKDEVLRLAFEALELANYKVADYCNGYTIEEVDEAITAIKAALEAPQRTWVGLTEEDEINWDGGDLKSLIAAVEAKLKEKNT